MIPNDLAARLRLLSESVVQPVTSVREVSSDLPELPIGQRFTARVESALPDGTFRALVAGRSLTLALPQLPQPAVPGDTLDLVVTARTPRLIVAEGAEGAPARQGASPTPPQTAAAPTPSTTPTPTSPPTPLPTLSRAGQIISTLLSGEERAPQPATLVRTTPLLPEPPLQAARLAPALQQAIVESGLFYEAHQAQWVAGRYPVEALAREPQARQARPSRMPDVATVQKAAEEAPTLDSSRGSSESLVARGSTATAPGLPAELQPLVQLQLDAAATQHIVWRGEVWPGQHLHWEIEADEQQRDTPDEAPAEQWTTTLGLALPRLGEVKVVLRLTSAKVSLAMTATADSAAALRQGLGSLTAAFAAAGLPPLEGGVESHESA